MKKDIIVIDETTRAAKEWATQQGLSIERCAFVTPRNINNVRGMDANEFHNPRELSLSWSEIQVITTCFSTPRQNRSRILRDFVLRQVKLT